MVKDLSMSNVYPHTIERIESLLAASTNVCVEIAAVIIFAVP